MKPVKYIISALLLITTTLSTTENLSATHAAAADSSIAYELNIHEFFMAVERNILNGLQSDNVDVVDSNLHHLILFKTDFSDFESSDIRNELTDMTFAGATHDLRYKAFLTLSYLNHQNDFNNLNKLQELISRNETQSIFGMLDEMVKSDFSSAVSDVTIYN